MKEKLDIRCLTERVYIPYIQSYPKFHKKWLKYQDGLVAIIVGYLDDPEFIDFLEYLKSKVDYAASSIERKYTPSELSKASLLTIWIQPTFEPVGEQLGTEYIYPCPVCKAGRIPKDNLILNLKKIPRYADIAKTIAEDEWVVSEKLALLIYQHKISGIELKPVEHYSKRILQSKWYQLLIQSSVEVAEQTKYGDAFRPNQDARRKMTTCGHTIEDVIYSELYIKNDSWDGKDAVKTKMFFGGHVNLIHPYPCILISQRFYQLLKENNIKGYKEEMAHLV